ncbi:MAG: SpvB/TcaC N-terminal domain-containing protein, partial [Bacteroidota bacterium]
MKYKDENKHKQSAEGAGKGSQLQEEGKSKQTGQSGKEASGEKNETASTGKQSFVNLPKGGGAIHGMGEKFQANPVTGTGSYTVPLIISAGRGEFTPQLALGYDSGSGNGSFGLGWNVGIPSVSRKTDKGLPQYLDLENHESDTFILSGAEDLVAILKEENGAWKHDTRTEGTYKVFPYQPRTEGLFAVIERWYDTTNKVSHWRSISKENTTSVYGLTNQAVIANTNHPEQIFTWMIEKSWNAKGNLIEFEYKRENYTAETGSGIASEVYEHQRRETNECLTNLYLKQVRYGNAAMYSPVYPAVPAYQNDWHFRLVFDYGDHPTNNPQVTPTQEWACRQDPFSTYKAGFEIRTYRLCKRVLMFHQFTELGTTPLLVKSTDFGYLEDEHMDKHLALLKTATHKGYLNGNSEELPTLSFTYSEAKLGTKIYEVSPEMLNNIPDGVDGRSSQWADLYSEGINGILKQDQNAWYFIPNKGDQRYYEEPVAGTPTEPELVLGGMRCELLKPAAVSTKKSSFHFADVDSDGLPELVINAPGMNGFYTRDENGQWQPFANFAEMPNLNLSDPNIKIVDLSGDGLGDIIIGKGDYFEIYLSEGKKGYGNYRRLRCNTTEEKGPKAIFSDELKQIYLADMSGDGLSDIVRITNGTLCYWPNLGYGHFGERVMMANPPYFERPDQFNPSQIRLADVDGTGTTDLIYFGSTTTKYWKNQAGNSWSEAQEINNFPQVDSMANAEVVDLFGNGTSCLIWSSKRPSQSRKMRYLELTSGIKPYLMIQSYNGMGGITKLLYTTSTKYYLRDKLSGHPWITRLPFPVHVLEHVEIHDEVTGSVFTNRYAYHHGYYDHDEREFRGFGMVEQWDTEKYNVLMNQFANVPINTAVEEIVPPVYVKTWFHTGFF